MASEIVIKGVEIITSCEQKLSACVDVAKSRFPLEYLVVALIVGYAIGFAFCYYYLKNVTKEIGHEKKN